MHRFFKNNISPNETEIVIQKDDAFHINSVLRLQKGDRITVCDGNMNDYVCEIYSTSKNEVTAKVIFAEKNPAEPKTKITLFQAMPKAGKMELIIQKSIELGIFNIVPVITEFTISRPKDFSGGKIERLKKISEAAAKQSGRGIIPEVSHIASFEDSIAMMKKLSLSIVAYEKERINSLKSALSNFNGQSIGIFIGSEGGFSEKEIEILTKNNVSCVTLGRRILRTETAGICAISAINYELEEF